MALPDPPIRNIRNAIKSFVPAWLSDRQGLNVGFAVLFVIALIADMLIETLYEGVIAPLPGKGDSSALPYIGRARGLIRGLTETEASYVARLIGWLDLWAIAGGAETFVLLIQVVLGNNLVVRLIDRAGNFVTANADGTTTKTRDVLWDWDSEVSEFHPGDSGVRTGWWGDTWLVVYTTDGRWPIYTSFSDPAWLATWGTSQGSGIGHQVPRIAVDSVYQILASFKGAHTWMSAMIFTDDTTLFVPGSLGSYPSGLFGNWSREDGSFHQVPARLTTHAGHYVRYWIPRFGG